MYDYLLYLVIGGGSIGAMLVPRPTDDEHAQASERQPSPNIPEEGSLWWRNLA
jgi:hypothetical protein